VGHTVYYTVDHSGRAVLAMGVWTGISGLVPDPETNGRSIFVCYIVSYRGFKNQFSVWTARRLHQYTGGSAHLATSTEMTVSLLLITYMILCFHKNIIQCSVTKILLH